MRPAWVCLYVCLVFAAASGSAGEWTEAEKAQIQELRKTLEKPTSVEMVDLPIFRALELISRKTGVPITLTGSPQDAIFQQAVNYSLESVRGLDLLDVLCRQAGLEYEVLPESVRVQSAAEFRRQRMKMVSYPLDDLTSAISDFPAPRLGRVFSSGGVNFITPTNPWMASEEIVELIRTIRPESWEAGYGASIQAKQGMVLVLQTEDVHALIRRLFAGLRARAGRQVSFDAWVYVVPSNNMDRLWNDVRTRGGRAPLLDDAAEAEIRKWAESGATEMLYSGSSVVFNLQRSHFGDMDYRDVIEDLDVSGEAYDPIVRARSSGVVIEARPVLSDDGSLISLGIEARYARVAPQDKAFQVIRGGVTALSGDITIRRKKPAGEVTDEFEVSNPMAAQTARRIPSYQISLPTTWHSRVSQDLMVPAGGYVALSAPICGEVGVPQGREMLVVLRCRPLIAQAPRMEPEEKEAGKLPEELAKRLEKKVSLTFLETPFEKALSVFAEQAGVPLVLDKRSLAGVLRTPTTWEGKDVRADEALRRLLSVGEADVVPYPSLLMVTSSKRVAARRMTLRIFDVSDMNKHYPDYANEYDLQVQTADPADASVGGAATPFVAAADMTVGFSDGEITELFQKELMPEAFSIQPSTIRANAGRLVVFHTPEVLDRIEKVLADFRKSARKPVAVDGRWLVVNRTDLAAAVGDDLPSTLTVEQTRKASALAGLPGTRDIAAGRMSCFNAQRVSTVGGCDRSYVSDYDLSGSLPDPVVRELLSGMILDVCPLYMEGTVEAGVPAQLRLDVRATLSWGDPNPPQVDPVMPEAERKNDAAPVLPGAIQAIRSNTTRLKTTVRIANGGAALFRFPVPAWIDGEDREKAKKGERVLVLLLRAEQ